MAQPAGDASRPLVETGHRRGSFQRRAIEPARHLDAGAGHGGGPVAHEVEHPIHVGDPRDPGIDNRPGLLGHDVGQGAAGHRAHVERHVGRQAAHALQIDDLGGELVDRAGSLVGLDPGVGGDPVDGEVELGAALAGRLHAPAGEPRLEHEGGPAPPRLLLDEGARGAAAALLVRGPQHDEPPRGGAHLEHRPGGQQAEGLGVVGRDPPFQSQPGDGPVHDPGVQEPVIQYFSQAATHHCLARSGRSVHGDGANHSSAIITPAIHHRGHSVRRDYHYYE